MTKHRITAAALSLSLLAGGAAAAAAATKEDKAPAAQFQTNLAKELGVSTAKLRAATKASGLDTVRALQAAGKLDAAKAAKATKAIEAGRSASFMQLGKRAKGGLRPAVLLATQLGAKPKDVRAAFKAGKTPASLITAAGKDVATVKAAIKADVRAKLGKRDAAKADARAEKVAARATSAEPVGGRKG